MIKALQLDEEEQALLDSVERGEWHSVQNLEEHIHEHKRIAANTLKKDTRINIRLTSRDVEKLKTNAAELGMPYQTLIASVLHQYVDGKLLSPQ